MGQNTHSLETIHISVGQDAHYNIDNMPICAYFRYTQS